MKSAGYTIISIWENDFKLQQKQIKEQLSKKELKMPTYTYLCEVNNTEFDTEHSIKTQLEECLICKENNAATHVPKRLISGAAPGRVEYTGHELASKNKEDVAKLKKEVYSSERLYSNMIGESAYQNLQTSLDRRNKS